LPAAPAHQKPGRQHGQTDEEEDVVDDGGGEVAVQHVVGHPQAATTRAVPARQRLEGADRKHEVGAVRIAETDVGEAAHEYGACAECAV
jgi:hypothetical protein